MKSSTLPLTSPCSGTKRKTTVPLFFASTGGLRLLSFMPILHQSLKLIDFYSPSRCYINFSVLLLLLFPNPIWCRRPSSSQSANNSWIFVALGFLYCDGLAVSCVFCFIAFYISRSILFFHEETWFRILRERYSLRIKKDRGFLPDLLIIFRKIT